MEKSKSLLEVYTFEMHTSTLVEVRGKINSDSVDQLTVQLDELLSKDRIHLVVDLSRVGGITAIGLMALVGERKRAVAAGGDIRLVAPLNPVRDVLMLSGLDLLFSIFPTDVEAVGSYTN